MFGRNKGKWVSILITTNKCKRLLSRKIKKKTSHLPLNFNNKVETCEASIVPKTPERIYLKNMFKKVNKTIVLLRKLQNNLTTAPLVTTCK